MNKKFLLLLLFKFILSCSKDDTNPIKDIPTVPSTEVITIPIVVHVINYTPDPFVISDEKYILK